MNTAFFCVLIASLLPILWIGVAKLVGGFSLEDNTHPRLSLDNLAGKAQRAKWAHDNSWEAFGPFAAAVIIGSICQVDQGTLNLVASLFILFRIFYGLAYIYDFPTLRSFLWSGGMLCNVVIYYLCL